MWSIMSSIQNSGQAWCSIWKKYNEGGTQIYSGADDWQKGA